MDIAQHATGHRLQDAIFTITCVVIVQTRQRTSAARAARPTGRPGQRKEAPRRRCDSTARRRGELGGGGGMADDSGGTADGSGSGNAYCSCGSYSDAGAESERSVQQQRRRNPECEKNRVRRGRGAHYVCGIEDTERRLRLRDSIRRDRKSFARVSTVCGLSVPMRCDYGTFLRVCDACRAL